MGYLATLEELQGLVARDRLAPVLCRYRGVTEGRFEAPAQDMADLVGMLEQTGRYVQDLFTKVTPFVAVRPPAAKGGSAPRHDEKKD